MVTSSFGSAWRVASYRFRTTLRRRFASYLALALLAGLVGGVALASVTAARRSYSSYPDYLASTNPSDLMFIPSVQGYDAGLIGQLARLQHVRSAEGAADFNAVTLTAAGQVRTVLVTQVELIASGDGLLSDQDRLTIIRGRRADPHSLNQIVATNEAAAVLGLHVGSHVLVGLIRNGGVNGNVTDIYRRIELTVVGIGVLNIQLVHDQIDTDRAGFLVGTPALLDKFGQCCATNSYDGLQLAGGSRYDSAVEGEYERLSLTSPYLKGGAGALVVDDIASIEAAAQQAIRPEVIALYVFGLIAGLAAVIIGAESISRMLLGNDADAAVLRALGASPAAVLAESLLGVLASVLAGAALAGLVAAALSPLTLFGPVRSVEPNGRPYLDWAVLGLGAAALAVTLGAIAAVVAYRRYASSIRRPDRPQGKASAVVRVALAGGLPASAVAGLRFALEPGHGRTAVPTRSVIAGAILTAAVVAATLTFGASLSTLISRPALYGWNFSYALYSIDGYGPVPAHWVVPLLRRDPYVSGYTGVYFATVQVDHLTVPAIGGTVHPAIGPQLLSGHGLDSASEIVVAPQTLSELHKRVGDTVTVSEGEILPPTRLRIVGTAAMPTIGDVIGVHASLSTGVDFAASIVPRSVLDDFGPVSGPNAYFVRTRPGVSAAAARRSLQHIASQLNIESRSPAVTAIIGDITKYVNAVSVLPVQRPAAILNYKSMGLMPVILAAGLAAGAVAGLGLTLLASVRRRRRDFALLKTLGFTKRQLVGTVAWQSTVVTAVGLAVGIPLGIAAGRWLWLAFARQLSAVPDPVVPVTTVAAVIGISLVLAGLVALGPGWRAAVIRPAAVLRSE